MEGWVAKSPTELKTRLNEDWRTVFRRSTEEELITDEDAEKLFGEDFKAMSSFQKPSIEATLRSPPPILSRGKASDLQALYGRYDLKSKRDFSEAFSPIFRSPDASWMNNLNKNSVCQVWQRYAMDQGSWKCREPQLKPLHEILRSGSVPPLYFSLRWLWACRVIGQSSQSSLALEKLLRTTRAKETDDKGDGGLEIYFHEPALSIWQAAVEGQDEISFHSENRGRSDSAREDIRCTIQDPSQGQRRVCPSECKNNWFYMKDQRYKGLQENLEGVGKVLKSTLVHCRQLGEPGHFLGVFFVRFTAIWLLEFEFSAEGTIDKLLNLSFHPHFPVSKTDNPALPLLGNFAQHRRIWPENIYPCTDFLEEGQQRPTLGQLLILEQGIPPAFKVLVHLGHELCHRFGHSISRVKWFWMGLGRWIDISQASIIYSSSNSVLISDAVLNGNILKINTQEMSAYESKMTPDANVMPGVRGKLRGGYGAVQIGRGCNLHGLLLAGHYEGHLMAHHVQTPDALDRIARQVMQAVDNLHQAQIFHRDLKPENVLLTSDGRAVVSDLGASCHAADTKSLTQVAGSQAYRSPAFDVSQKYNRCDDVLGLGLMLAKLLGPVKLESSSDRLNALLEIVAPTSRIPLWMKDRLKTALEDSRFSWELLMQSQGLIQSQRPSC